MIFAPTVELARRWGGTVDQPACPVQGCLDFACIRYPDVPRTSQATDIMLANVIGVLVSPRGYQMLDGLHIGDPIGLRASFRCHRPTVTPPSISPQTSPHPCMVPQNQRKMAVLFIVLTRDRIARVVGPIPAVPV